MAEPHGVPARTHGKRPVWRILPGGPHATPGNFLVVNELAGRARRRGVLLSKAPPSADWFLLDQGTNLKSFVEQTGHSAPGDWDRFGATYSSDLTIGATAEKVKPVGREVVRS